MDYAGGRVTQGAVTEIFERRSQSTPVLSDTCPSMDFAKKRNPPILQNVGLRYRASLDKLTQPTGLGKHKATNSKK